MYSAYPGYSGTQAPSLNRYYYPSSSSPPDPEELARQQRKEDEKRQQLYARLLQKNTDESSSSGSESPVVARPPSVSSADSSTLQSVPSFKDDDWEWLESTEKCHACWPLQCNEQCATREEHDGNQNGNHRTRRARPPRVPRPTLNKSRNQR